MSTFYVRNMTLKDIPFFITQCEESARDRHLHSDLLTARGSKSFEKDVREVLRLHDVGQPSAHFLVMLVRASDERPAGFMWVRSAEDLTGTRCIEIFVVHVAKPMRGKGGGQLLISLAIEGYGQHRITARCYPASALMNRMLRQRGFEVMGTSERGAHYLCRLPS